MKLQKSFSKSRGSHAIVVILQRDNHTTSYSDSLGSRFDNSDLLVARCPFLIKYVFNIFAERHVSTWWLYTAKEYETKTRVDIYGEEVVDSITSTLNLTGSSEVVNLFPERTKLIITEIAVHLSSSYFWKYALRFFWCP